MTAVATGARGVLDGTSYTVLGNVKFAPDDGEPWTEYLLASGRDRRWLTFDRDRGHAYLWRLVKSTHLAKAGELRIGDTVAVENLMFDIDAQGVKNVVSFEGNPEDDAEPGERVQYAEGRANGDLRVSIERWQNETAEAFVGIPVPIRATEAWKLHAPPLPRRTKSELRRSSTSDSFLAGAVGALLLGFIVLSEGCWREDECRYYQADGTSYTAPCSHNNSRSVRVESTGRRLSGFGK